MPGLARLQWSQAPASARGAARQISFIHFWAPSPSFFLNLNSILYPSTNIHLGTVTVHCRSILYYFRSFISLHIRVYCRRCASDTTLHCYKALIFWDPGPALPSIALFVTLPYSVLGPPCPVLGAMRRQNRSCDQCRKAKRACDAPSLWDIQRNSERLRNGADGASGASLAEEHLGEFVSSSLLRLTTLLPLIASFSTVDAANLGADEIS